MQLRDWEKRDKIKVASGSREDEVPVGSLWNHTAGCDNDLALPWEQSDFAFKKY